MMFKVVMVMIFTVAVADIVLFKDCGSVSGNIKSVDVSACKQLPCPLKQGTNVSVAVDFLSKTSSETVSVVVTGILGKIPIPFPTDQPDGCKSGIKCPLHKGDENNYKTNLYVRTYTPKIKLVVKWELKDEKTDDLVCFLFPVEIV